MSKINIKARAPKVYTHGHVPAASNVSILNQLRRSVLSCLLWEREYYEDGIEIATRISHLASQVSDRELADLAIEARNVHNLRHVPLLLLTNLVKRGGRVVGDAIYNTLERVDELPELLAIYWSQNKDRGKAGQHTKHATLPKQLKLGLARAFRKFDGYQLAKYNRDSEVKLRDVLFLSHAKPRDDAQAVIWKHLVDGTLKAPDTWEVALSGGADKKETFERLIRSGNLGYFALLRNLRNMVQAGVDLAIVREAILERRGAQRILPFRFVAAARAAPQLEPELDKALVATIGELPQLEGSTVVLVDVSGSMNDRLSSKSDLKRMDAAATLASMINAQSLRVFSFSMDLVEVPPRRGMAGVDVISKSPSHGGTNLAGAVAHINAAVPCDRLIVITDEQATDARVPAPKAARAYMINVASAKNGVGYGRWTHLDGFSENVLRWIVEFERGEEV